MEEPAPSDVDDPGARPVSTDRPRVWVPFVLLLLTTAMGAAVALPLIGEGLQESTEAPDAVLFAGLAAYAVGAVWLIFVRWQERTPSSVGFHRQTVTVANALGGTVLGLGSIAVATLIAVAAGGLERTGSQPVEPSAPTVVVAIVAFFFSAVFQQVFLVSGMMAALRVRWRVVPAMLVPSAIFGLFHLGDGTTVFAVINTVLFGVVFGLLFFGGTDERPTLGAGIALHTVWNVTIAFVVGTALSGNTTPWGTFGLVPTDTLWSGGAYGLEGSLSVTIVLAAVVAGLAARRVRSRA